MSSIAIKDFALEVLKTEADSILGASASIDTDFFKAVETIRTCQGKVIVTGVGKSGNIAAKIASTMASTGTPAFFIHPTDASHGDLGIICKNDIVLALSNSGETSELFNIITYVNRFSIPLICMVSNANSTLARSSNIRIIVPKLKEAGNLNVAPTSSTTAMLAIGDALALTVCNEKNFTLSNFKTFHPGGTIGRSLIRVADIMKTGASQIPFGPKSLSATEVLRLVSEKGQGCLAIIDEAHEIQGIITDGDLRRAFDQEFFTKTAADIMTRGPVTISEDDLAVNAVRIMHDRLITNLLVTASPTSKKLVGILHLLDCTRCGVA